MKINYKKNIVALCAFIIIIFNSLCVQASQQRVPYVTKTFYVGSTPVEIEVGYNNNKSAYATVSSLNGADIDASMVMTVYYTVGETNQTHSVKCSMSQKTYDSIGWECTGTIYRVECNFTVISADGQDTVYLGT